MISYRPGMEMSHLDFQPYDATEGGALETDGDLKTEISVDHHDDSCMGGLFRQVKGRAEIVWPATEHAFVIEGEVNIHYHAEDKTERYGPGDGWIIRKGERVSWSVTSDTFVKSFFLLL